MRSLMFGGFAQGFKPKERRASLLKFVAVYDAACQLLILSITQKRRDGRQGDYSVKRIIPQVCANVRKCLAQIPLYLFVADATAIIRIVINNDTTIHQVI
jgi:hypothetical protein